MKKQPHTSYKRHKEFIVKVQRPLAKLPKLMEIK